VLLLRLLAGDRPRAATLVGLAIGFSGVALLVLRGSHGSGAGVEHALVVVAGALAWATGSFLSSRLPLPADVSAGTAIEMIVGGAVLAVLAVVFGESWSQLWLHASVDSLLALVYLAAIGSIVAFTAYVWLLQNVPISKISTYAYVNPVVAVVLGALVLGEAITGLMVVGGLITVAAVAVVIRSESRASSEPGPVEPPPPPALALEGPAEVC
jgi:drug/metabolite transporter (DMT)-like permease